MSIQVAGAVPTFDLGDRLRKAREFAGMSQDELGAMIGVSRRTVVNNEGGKVAPRRTVLIAWALATGVDRVWLETGEDPRPADGPDGGLGGECASRDSNPEPADSATRQVIRLAGRDARGRVGRDDDLGAA